ncbi:putative patatin/cPLA2 family phospholipase [Saccharothrix tamanrassetensis]|uniref:Putative patatin/cPLA2 family phospholipase n=1 Tax=Saccharothrix tamanrassetensis TaxID=1051531 RepID=A0A841CL80_9PSEU|nr:patatin-like phospholipase family protein [Saccharothrix tamanrassetensis]MBB5957124.1 putative patatin/cPLA2 family phospholipase [Saccharothrix tamanrassetensis]
MRDVLHRRRAGGSKPGRRSDGFKVGLAIEGGGLRGVVSGAMLSALEDMGFADSFDDVYTCSSGAVNGAYFITRRTWFPLSIYFDDLTTGVFLDFRRVFRGAGPMNLEYVFEEVLAVRKPLDYAAIIAAPQRLHVMVTIVDELRTLDVHEFHSPEDLRSALRASTWLPLAIRGTTDFRGQRAIDGGVLRFHPFRAAVLDGCTHVLSLSTRPIAPSQAGTPLINRLVARHLERLRPGLGTGFITSMDDYRLQDRPRLARSRLHPGEPAILDLAPLPGTPEVKRHEVDRGKLLDGARSAYRLAHEVLEGKDVVVVPRLTVYPPRSDAEGPT